MLNIESASNFIHTMLKNHVNPGDITVDATAGNGNDTALLAELTGAKGMVYAFDIQKKALENTALRLEKNNLSERVKLIHDSHDNIDKYIFSKISTAVFNLGYLPSADRNIITKPETTINALKKIIEILNTGGLITIISYLKHKGGMKEKNYLEDYLKTREQKDLKILKSVYFADDEFAPIIFLINKKTHNFN